METHNERALTRHAAAALIGVSASTLGRLVGAGLIPPPRQVSPGRVAHLESELVEYLRNRPAAPIAKRTEAATARRKALLAGGRGEAA